MISKTKLLNTLRLSIGNKVLSLIPNEFIDNILENIVLPRFSDWYPQLYDIRITADCAIPYRGYSGVVNNYQMYRIPKQFDVPFIDSNDDIIWRDIEDYHILGNDYSDIYTGSNFLFNSMFINTATAMPHTRSYFMLTFQEPDLLIVDPPFRSHRNFSVTMQAERNLKQIPRNMETLFQKYFIEHIKLAIYNEFKYEDGNQTYGGIEIETKLGDFNNAEGKIEELEQIFNKDWYLNPERFNTICLYQRKA